MPTTHPPTLAERPAIPVTVRVPARPARSLPERLSGDYRCRACGYGLSHHRGRRLPACPMCRQRDWQLVAWRPLGADGPARP